MINMPFYFPILLTQTNNLCNFKKNNKFGDFIFIPITDFG